MKTVQTLAVLLLMPALVCFSQNRFNLPLMNRLTSGSDPSNGFQFLSALNCSNRPIDNLVRNAAQPFGMQLTLLRSISGNDTAFRRVVWKPFEFPTMAVQAGAGFSDAAICLILANVAGRSGSIGGSVVLGMLSAVFAAQLPFAIYYPGETMGGDGSLFWTFAGCIAGGSIAILPSMELWPNDVMPIAILTSIFAVGGGILGYHYFASPVYEFNPTNPLNDNQQHYSMRLTSPNHSLDSFRLKLLSISF